MNSTRPKGLGQRRGVAAVDELFDPNEYITIAETRQRVQQVLGRPVSLAAIRRWVTAGTVSAGVLQSRRVLNRRLVMREDLERYLLRVLGEEDSVS